MSKDTQDVSRKRTVNLEKSVTQEKGYSTIRIFLSNRIQRLLQIKSYFAMPYQTTLRSIQRFFQKDSLLTFTFMTKEKARRLKV